MRRGRRATFLVGQTLSALGDSFSFVAIPLLILKATGSLVQMGLVTGLTGVPLAAPGTPVTDDLLSLLLFITTGLTDLIIYYLKHDLGRSDSLPLRRHGHLRGRRNLLRGHRAGRVGHKVRYVLMF